MDKFKIAGYVAIAIFVAIVAIGIAQRTTCFDFFGLAKGCVLDTTKH